MTRRPTSPHRPLWGVLVSVLLIGVSLWVLQAARSGVVVTTTYRGDTPVTTYALPGADGPVVVVAHGFAGSRQMMQGYALPLAQAGYRVHAFDFQGHGRNSVPMSGDVTAVDGTTGLLVAQTRAVIDAVADGDAPVALLGHSMATDVLVRAAQGRDDAGPLVLISAFSGAIDAQFPANLLLISGAWEGPLRRAALDAARLVDPGAAEDETVTAQATTQGAVAPPSTSPDTTAQVIRRAQVAPWTEHVAVLHSRVGRTAALDWLDAAYGRTSDVPIRPTGWALLGVLAGIVGLGVALLHCLPMRDATPRLPLSRARLALVTGVPLLVAPLVAVPLDPSVLPVLVADYLALHLAIFGAVQLALIAWWRWPVGRVDGRALLVLLAVSAVFGAGLDRYGANFWPTPGRGWIIAALALGTLPAMLADAVLTHGASVWRRIVLRGGFLVSLALAVALNPGELFFLIIIAPVILLFYAVFGTLGRAASGAAGPLAPGIALGLVLAWALGVSFPLFQA
ncbi:Alpha/beta hydrolase family protein [Loktanella fryxellensis]|uniref:Alpha/beta hydrolase family protein n=1 Tax=Loktanella fryxellensis TaxID=245187 RepID=A0A1H8GQ57_9RHOB|nr:alpha/beta hydrolase [Loktanella fryxellensis]SEN45970.1 Alpha/beta hydrolase family protein [Loktanella fryxellensis]